MKRLLTALAVVAVMVGSGVALVGVVAGTYSAPAHAAECTNPPCG